jgi:methyl-CpG-binding domain protein 4
VSVIHFRSPAVIQIVSAKIEILAEILHPLGLQNVRAARLIKFSQKWIQSPPSDSILHPSRVPTDKDYPSTPVSHLMGCGKYALDSYRIFCAGGDEWKKVLPTDKELIKYLVCIFLFESLVLAEMRTIEVEMGYGRVQKLESC